MRLETLISRYGANMPSQRGKIVAPSVSPVAAAVAPSGFLPPPTMGLGTNRRRRPSTGASCAALSESSEPSPAPFPERGGRGGRGRGAGRSTPANGRGGDPDRAPRRKRLSKSAFIASRKGRCHGCGHPLTTDPAAAGSGGAPPPSPRRGDPGGDRGGGRGEVPAAADPSPTRWIPPRAGYVDADAYAAWQAAYDTLPEGPTAAMFEALDGGPVSLVGEIILTADRDTTEPPT